MLRKLKGIKCVYTLITRYTMMFEERERRESHHSLLGMKWNTILIDDESERETVRLLSFRADSP